MSFLLRTQIFSFFIAIYVCFNLAPANAQQVDEQSLLEWFVMFKESLIDSSQFLSDADDIITENYDIANGCIIEFKINNEPGKVCSHYFDYTYTNLVAQTKKFAAMYKETESQYSAFVETVTPHISSFPREHLLVLQDISEVMEEMNTEYSQKLSKRQSMNEELDEIRVIYEQTSPQ